jgi:SAM-dependent methyltransferase
VLDLGCATGDWTREYGDFGDEVLGVDISEQFIREAEARQERSEGQRHVRFRAMNLVDFDDYAEADLICFGGTFHLIDDESIEEIFSRIARAAEPGTIIYVRVGVSCLRRRTYRTPKGNYRHRRWYRACFARHGLEVLDSISSPSVVASELAREAAKGSGFVGSLVKGLLHGIGFTHHFFNGRNDYLNWICRVRPRAEERG